MTTAKDTAKSAPALKWVVPQSADIVQTVYYCYGPYGRVRFVLKAEDERLRHPTAITVRICRESADPGHPSSPSSTMSASTIASSSSDTPTETFAVWKYSDSGEYVFSEKSDKGWIKISSHPANTSKVRVYESMIFLDLRIRPYNCRLPQNGFAPGFSPYFTSEIICSYEDEHVECIKGPYIDIRSKTHVMRIKDIPPKVVEAAAKSKALFKVLSSPMSITTPSSPEPVTPSVGAKRPPLSPEPVTPSVGAKRTMEPISPSVGAKRGKTVTTSLRVDNEHRKVALLRPRSDIPSHLLIEVLKYADVVQANDVEKVQKYVVAVDNSN